MQRSSSNNHGNYVGQCTMLFNHNPFDDDEGYPISSSSVDCTLSLATPSSRQTEDKKINCHRRSGSFMSKLCWGTLKNPSSSAPTHKNNPRCSNSIINTSDGGDPLLARRCTNCGTTSTPLWRNGPRGPKSLCNACGIRYKKEERRATSTTATPPTIIEAQHMMSHHHQSWAHQSSPALTTEFSFIGDDSESDRSVPLLSWRLNVPDRASLVHDYTY